MAGRVRTIIIAGVFPRFFRSTIPDEYRLNFIHLYFDMGWFGILSGSSVNFLNIFAARLGAGVFEIGLLGAMSAAVSLVLAIPAGHWIGRRHIGKAVFWTSVFYRIGFLLWIPLPWLFNNAGQVWALIVLAFLMAIPLTPLSVGFNALFASAVPLEYRAHVVGYRNMILSVTYIIASIGSGFLLDAFRFPVGYQIVFGIGFLGAAMSSLHLYFIRPAPEPVGDLPQFVRTGQPPASKIERPQDWRANLRLDIWQTPFRAVLLGLLGFHLTQYLALPIFPLFQVNNLHLADDQIGVGAALFYLIVLIGSTQLRSLVQRIGHHKVTAAGVIAMGLYPFFLALSRTALHYYAVSALGGLAWALAGGAYANYLLEHIPAAERPAYLAWYNVVLNACVLAGSLIGPLIASQIGLVAALFAFAAARILSGFAILKWGLPRTRPAPA